MMHEFGHTAGLGDLYDPFVPNPKDYVNFLMNNLEMVVPTPISGTYPRPGPIPTADVGYLGQAYRNEHGSEPH